MDCKDDKDVKEKTKAKKNKLTKDAIQVNIIEEFKKDGENILEDRNDYGCDVFSKKCRKCDYETHSEGVLRLHKVEDHNTKESKENIIIGFKNDIEEHIKFLNEMEEKLKEIKCDQFSFMTHSFGHLQIHVYSTH